MQRDPEYFPEPMSYQPERYLEENRNYNRAAFMPFGEGPRACIGRDLCSYYLIYFLVKIIYFLGARMGRVNVKLAVAKVLTNFDLEVRAEKQEIEIGIHGIPLMAKEGIPVRLSRKN